MKRKRRLQDNFKIFLSSLTIRDWVVFVFLCLLAIKNFGSVKPYFAWGIVDAVSCWQEKIKIRQQIPLKNFTFSQTGTTAFDDEKERFSEQSLRH